MVQGDLIVTFQERKEVPIVMTNRRSRRKESKTSISNRLCRFLSEVVVETGKPVKIDVYGYVVPTMQKIKTLVKRQLCVLV